MAKILVGNVKGDKGEDGRGISKIEKTASSGLVDTYTATFSDGSAAGSFTVTNGVKGDKGDKGPQGPKGATGPTGATGATGQRGSQWYSGTAVTGTSTTGAVFSTGISSALVGDYYLNTSTGAVYRCTVSGAASAAKWAYAGSIKGATGAQGPQGPKGLKGDTGATGATGAQGPTGPQGPRGNTGPQGIQGVKGDTGATGPKGATGAPLKTSSIQYQAGASNTTPPSGTWSNSVVSAPQGQYLWTKLTYSDGSVSYSVARQGHDGATGAKGDKGDTGARGPQGLKGDTGAQGPQGLKGDKGDAGITVPASGLFSLGVDNDGNLVAYYSDAASTPPRFEYDRSTGNVYYIIQEG